MTILGFRLFGGCRIYESGGVDERDAAADDEEREASIPTLQLLILDEGAVMLFASRSLESLQELVRW